MNRESEALASELNFRREERRIAQDAAFKTNPGKIASEHEKDVQGLFTEAAKKADKSKTAKDAGPGDPGYQTNQADIDHAAKGMSGKSIAELKAIISEHSGKRDSYQSKVLTAAAQQVMKRK